MPSEFDIIARHFAPIAGPGGLGLLDDAALLKAAPDHELVVTTDAIVAGVHFFADDPAGTIAVKALATNLSDLAAKGARPLGFVLTIMLPKPLIARVDDDWLAAFAEGLGGLSRTSACPLVGGDTVSTPGPLAISITAIGEVPTGTMVRRSTARTGDHLFVTGTIGDSAIGLKLLEGERGGKTWPLARDHADFLKNRYRCPRARIAVATVVRRYATAAMDISDGFAGDLAKMISLAGCGADVVLDDVPLSVAARGAIRFQDDLRETAFTGGDDYELLTAVAPEKSRLLMEECLAAGVAVSRVGTVTDAGGKIRFLDQDGTEHLFRQASYSHG